MGVSGVLRGFLRGQLLEFTSDIRGILVAALGVTVWWHVPLAESYCSWQYSKRRVASSSLHSKKNKKKKRESAVWKRACEGARRNAPSPWQKRPWTQCVRGSLWPSGSQTRPSKTQKRRGPTLRARGAPLTLTRARGWARSPSCPLRWDHLLGHEKVCGRRTNTKGGKRNTRQEKHGKPLPPRVPRKRPQKVQGESQKRPGPRMAPREKRQEAGRTAKTGETDRNAAGHKKEKREQAKQGACAGVSCDYLIFISEKRKKKQKNGVDEKNQRKRERTRKKPDLTSIEFFQTGSGSETPKNKAKTISKNPPKNTRPTQPPKNKSSLPKIFPKSVP